MKQREVQHRRSAEIAYRAIAPVYDDFTDHHEMDLWLRELLGLLEGLGLQGNRVLDVACGTGKSFMPLLDRGWSVTACDISAEMIEIARRKVGDRVKLSVADMRQLPVLGQFDVVMCLGDAVNYLLSVDELEKALRRMGANLKPSGLLIFDTNTLESFRTFFAEEVCVERGGRRMIWRGLTDPAAAPGVLGEALFEVEAVGAGISEVPPEIHLVRHFLPGEVHAALERAELQIAGTFGHTKDGIPQQPLDESVHSKAIFVARPASFPRPLPPRV